LLRGKIEKETSHWDELQLGSYFPENGRIQEYAYDVAGRRDIMYAEK